MDILVSRKIVMQAIPDVLTFRMGVESYSNARVTFGKM
jgi:hypothetical protein